MLKWLLIFPALCVISGRAAPDSHDKVAASIYFDYSSTRIRSEYKAIVAAHAKRLKVSSGLRVRVEGHADERGSREFNLAVGQVRADMVKQMLVRLGALPSQVETVSFGEERPVCKASTEKGWVQNRRADIVYFRE